MKLQLINARNRFKKLDGDKFGAVLYETSAGHYSLEWRIRKADKKMAIIQYDGIFGKYQIYAAE